MPTGWFSKRLTFNKYIFCSRDAESVEVWGHEAIILDWVEYDISINNSFYFTTFRSRARPWSRELQYILCPKEIKVHETPASIPDENKTRRFRDWLIYNDVQEIKQLVLDRPNDKKAIGYFREKDWERLVNEFHVCPTVLTRYLAMDHALVARAFMINEFMKCMKRHCLIWIDDDHASVPIIYQESSVCMNTMMEGENKMITLQVDEETSTACLALEWAASSKPKNINVPTYPSWGRFLKQRVIPNFTFPIEHPIWEGNQERLRIEIPKRYNNGNMVAKAAAPHIRLYEPYVWVNCYTHALTVKVKETCMVEKRSWTQGDVYKLTDCDHNPNHYVCNGMVIPYETVYSKFKNCHPCTYEMISDLKPGSTNIVLCVDFNTPDWVYLDAHFAAQGKQIICIYVSNLE